MKKAENFDGKLIAIDGTDGTGKATQITLLQKRLRKAGYRVKVLDFPQYGEKSAGLVEEYLNGKYGSAKDVGPYRASIFYACDRYAASFKLKEYLQQGYIVLSNRYVTANMAHQGCKIQDKKERKKFFTWLFALEYDIFDIPRPHGTIIMHADAKIAQRMINGKKDRAYIQGKKKRDLHERDTKHLQSAEKVFMEIVAMMPKIKCIECSQGKSMKSIEAVHTMLWDEVLHIINKK